MTYLERDPELKGASPTTPKHYSVPWYRREMDFLMRLAFAGRIKRGVDWDDGDGLHTHVCGYSPDRPIREGCGYVFRHATPMNGRRPGLYDTKKELDAAHKCPQCGREEWTAKRLPGDPRLTKEYQDEP